MAESNTQKVLRILLSPYAALETAFQQLLTERNVNTARGVHLDAIGKIVGRPREGVTDDEVYRRYVRAQVSANKSDGLIEDLLTVARLVVFDEDATIEIDNVGNAAFILRIEGVALDPTAEDPLVDLVLAATAGGVRALISYSKLPPADRLRWGSQGTWGVSSWTRVRSKAI